MLSYRRNALQMSCEGGKKRDNFCFLKKTKLHVASLIEPIYHTGRTQCDGIQCCVKPITAEDVLFSARGAYLNKSHACKIKAA